MSNRVFLAGDPVPWFVAPSPSNPEYHFSVAAGRYVVLMFLGSSSRPGAGAALDRIMARGELFDDIRASFFGVSTDPADQDRLRQRTPGIRYFWDFQYRLSRLYGALSGDGGADAHSPFWLLLDPMLRVLSTGPLEAVDTMLDRLSALPPPDRHAEVPVTAPVLVLPRVFEPDFCRRLIDLYDARGGVESGFMRVRDGKTVGVLDDGFKKRADCAIEDEEIRQEARRRISARILPELGKAFNFRATRIERYIVACYDGASGGFFRAHRDNTTPGTAHRQFAVTINLNAEEYEGGDLRFPEFGTQTYRAPTGGAVVFGCSLLHEAMPVTSGRRYAFLPFLYDEEGAKIRERNAASVTGEVQRVGG
ncbi:MAG TPA: 2OG-Fe(II) oxygenase [Azospirillaceae bacterium]|nr:2OG-Fe(II) oxygenase [Azospirillaceae bacterium]